MSRQFYGHLLLVFMLTASCSHEPVEQVAQPDAPPRIACMSPALTAMLVELGLEGSLVGRSSFCETRNGDIPVIGDLLDVHWESLVRVRPTHVLVQGKPEHVSPEVLHVAEDRGWTLLAYPLVDASDIKTAMQKLPIDLELGGGDAEYALQRAAEFSMRVDSGMASPVDTAVGQKVLLLTPGEQMLGWGRATYLSDVMEKLGAINVLQFNGWRQLGAEEIVRSNVDCIILASSGPVEIPGGFLEHLDRMDSNPRIAVMVHPGLLLPSTRLPELIEAMRSTLSSSGEGVSP